MYGHLPVHRLKHLPLVAKFLTPKFVLGIYSHNAKKLKLKTMPLNNIEKITIWNLTQFLSNLFENEDQMMRKKYIKFVKLIILNDIEI